MARSVSLAVILMLTASVSAKDFNNGMVILTQNEVAPAMASQEELIAEGASVYRTRCARCHGHDG